MSKHTESVLPYAVRARRKLRDDWRIYFPLAMGIGQVPVLVYFSLFSAVSIWRPSLDGLLLVLAAIWFLPSLGVLAGVSAPTMVEESLGCRLTYLLGMVMCILLWLTAPTVVFYRV